MSNYCDKGHWEAGMVLPCKQCRIEALESERDQLRKDVTLLRDAVKFWMRAEGNYDLMKADKKFQEALAATEPKE